MDTIKRFCLRARIALIHDAVLNSAYCAQGRLSQAQQPISQIARGRAQISRVCPILREGPATLRLSGLVRKRIVPTKRWKTTFGQRSRHINVSKCIRILK
jgi:hypothetical protein